MRTAAYRLLWSVIVFGGAVSLAACSKQGGSSTAAATPRSRQENVEKPVVPPAVSIGEALPVLDVTRDGTAGATTVAARVFTSASQDESEADEPEEALVEPEPGTPEWLIREITRIQSAPLDVVRTPVPGKPGEFAVVELTEQQMDAEEKRRAEKVIGLSLEACGKTKDSAEKTLLFNNAVHYLAGARTTLAGFGDHDQVRLLGEEAEMLFQRDPKSFGAVELQIRLVECLAELAEQDGRKNDSWGQMAAKQARLFASRFPQESNRCALALVIAARACEVGGRFDDAKYCFGVLERDFAKTPFAEQAAGAIRRYKLAGQPLTEFAGATIEGGFLSIEELKGKTVLIVFWSAESPSFREDLPRLKQLLGSQAGRGISVVGVNMDVDESVVDAFLEQAELPWRTIFFSSVDQRGIRNPLARAYGVTTVPQYWLVDARGTVVAAPLDLKSLSTKFSQVAEQGGAAPRR